jgi:hypothetical protein
MTQKDFLLMLTQSSLWGRKLRGGPIDHDHFLQLMELADRQTVRGLVCNTLVNLSKGVVLPSVDAFEAYQSIDQIDKQNAKLLHALASLVRLFDDSCIPFVVMKGQTIEALYPLRHLRIPGDIDFYVSEQYFDQAKELILKKWDVKYNVGDGNMHIEFTYEDVVFEMHFKLLCFSSRKIQCRFNKILANAVILRRDIDGVSAPVFTPEFEILYTFLHLYHHFMELGVGIRHLCDFAVLCRRQKDLHLNSNLLKDELKRLCFYHAFTAFEFVGVKALGLLENELPLPVSSCDRKYCSSILHQIFLRGNMGLYGKKYKVRSGLGYNLEAFKIKIYHRFRFFWLSPRENISVVMQEIPNKIRKALEK